MHAMMKNSFWQEIENSSNRVVSKSQSRSNPCSDKERHKRRLDVDYSQTIKRHALLDAYAPPEIDEMTSKILRLTVLVPVIYEANTTKSP